MNIDYLREFLVLSEVKNYQRAADMLYISQTSLTRHMQTLEDSLGIELFDRSSRSNKLTALGQSYQLLASSVLDSYENSRLEIIALKHRNQGNLSIAVPYNYKFYGISKILMAFMRKYPDIKVNISERSSHMIREMIMNNTISFGFLFEISSASSDIFHTYNICSDCIAICLSARHQLANNDVITPEMLRKETFALPPNKGPIYTNCFAACINAGFSPNVLYTVSIENIYELVENELCVAFVPKKPALATHPSTTVIRDFGIDTSLNINLAFSNNILSDSESCFIDFIESYQKSDYLHNS